MISPISSGNSTFYLFARLRTGMMNAARTRTGQTIEGGLSGSFPTGNGRRVDGQNAPGANECQTCKNRKYKDASTDPGVSFKTATRLDPTTASYAIRAHEGQHVSRAWAQAAQEDKEVVSQSVSYRTAICPECGRTYMSGGTTRTVFRSVPETYEAERVQRGRFLDVRA